MAFQSSAQTDDSSAAYLAQAGTLAQRRDREPSRELAVVRGRPSGLVPSAPSAAVARAASERSLSRYRIHVGELIVDLRYFARETTADVLVPRARALLLLPLNGPADMAAGDETRDCPAATPFLFAGKERLGVTWRAGSVALFVYLKRDRLNAAASAMLADGRRLAAMAMPLVPAGDDRRLERAADRIISLCGNLSPSHCPASFAVETELYQALACRLASSADVQAILPPVRAVSEAMRLVRDDHRRAFDVESLAAMAGVTGQTLRKGFRACLGITVKEYIRTIRLEWAREQLKSARESRSIADLALAAGFADTPAFSRGYLRHYGESPSQTRARAVQLAG